MPDEAAQSTTMTNSIAGGMARSQNTNTAAGAPSTTGTSKLTTHKVVKTGVTRRAARATR